MYRLDLTQGLEVRGAYLRLEQPIPVKPNSDVVTLTGEGATARGLLEANAQFIAAYPGLPTMWVPDLLAPYVEDRRFHLEWSVSEKVALEAAAGAAMLGARAASLMEDVGVNVASDSLFPLAMAGVQAGMVIVFGSDAGVRNAPAPMDSRHYAPMAGLLGLVAVSPQEQKDMVVEAFRLSEESGLPVMVQLPIDVGEQRGAVRLLPLPEPPKTKPVFQKASLRQRYAGSFLDRKRRLWELHTLLQSQANRLPFNQVQSTGREKTAILACGPTYRYVREALEKLSGPEIAVIKIGAFHPIPDKIILPVLGQVEDILVVEEQDPLVETQVRVLAQKSGRLVRIHGKDDGTLPAVGPCTARVVLDGIRRVLGLDAPRPTATITDGAREALRKAAPDAFGNNCPGCPHVASLWALKKAMESVGGNYVVTANNGCQLNNGYDLHDAQLSFGAGVALASGMAQVGMPGVKSVAVVGDSGFFHNGLQGLINATNTGADLLVYILDNGGAAGSGGQPSPNVGILASGEPTKMVSIARLAQVCNADFVKVIDPYQLPEAQKVLEEALRKPGQRVVVASRECIRMVMETTRAQGREMALFQVDPAKCNGCNICVADFHCSAISFSFQSSKAAIDRWLCTGCGACATICPTVAIHRKTP